MAHLELGYIFSRQAILSCHPYFANLIPLQYKASDRQGIAFAERWPIFHSTCFSRIALE